MAFFAVLSMGTLQSCTDDLSDFEHQYAYDQYNLGETISGIEKTIADNKAELEAEIADLQAQITSNDGDIANLQQQLTQLTGDLANYVKLEELEKRLKELQDDLSAYEAANDAALDALKKEIEQDIAEVNATIANMDADYQAKFADYTKQLEDANSKIDAVQKDVTDALTAIADNKAAIEAIQSKLNELENLASTVEANKEAIATLTQQFQDLEKKYDAQIENLSSELEEAYRQIQETQTFVTWWCNLLQDQIDNLADEVDSLKTAIEALEDEFDLLTMRVNELITSILLQATDSPVFGNLSLPLGIQSNILFNWLFENKGQSFSFPTAQVAYAYNAAEILAGNSSLAVSDEDVATAVNSKNSTFTVPEGYADVNLGKLYMTINPVGHQVLDGKTFYVETSKGEDGRLPFTLDVQPSDDELYFGYNSTRSVENGFYESEVVVSGDAESLAPIRLTMDESLKEAGKAVLDERTKISVINFLKAAYDEINSSFPRYAVRAEWADANKGSRQLYSVLSQYDLGIATAKPLSYMFLEGKSVDHRLPILGSIANLITRIKESGKLHFELNAEDYPVTIELSAPEDADYVGTVTITITDANGNVIGSASADSMDELNKAINEGITGTFEEVGISVNEQIKEQLAEIIDTINSQVNGKIESVLEELEADTHSWVRRLDKLIDLYNRVANKVNSFLEDPNAYLQPAMFYKTSTGIGIVSQSKSDPTVFSGVTNGSFILYPSSYTLELVVPAYKKMIACVNVIDSNTGEYVSNGRELAKAVNNACDEFAVVLDGARYGIGAQGSAFESGYTYEIMYQALDYSGITSTRKFYIKVK